MILARPAGGGAPRVVITDFGLARSSGGGDASLTGGQILGTPAYMAPEQVTGAEAGPAADVYALGVVLYEMVTGTLPFAGDTPLAVAARRLTEAPPSPATRVPGLAPSWERTILRCLEREPAARPASVEAVLRLLGEEAASNPNAASATGETVAVAAPPATTGRPESASAAPPATTGRPHSGTSQARPAWRRGRALVAAGLLAVAVVAAVSVVVARRPASRNATPAAATGTAPAARSVAVVGFRNLGQPAQDDWRALAVAEALTAALDPERRITVAPPEDVERMRLDLSLSLSDRYPPESLERIRTYLGAEVLVLGAVSRPAPDRLRVEVSLQPVVGGEVMRFTEEGPADEVAELGLRAAHGVAARLGLPALPDEAAAAARAALPAAPEAARLYVLGLQKGRRFDARGARELLREAVQAAPTFAPARAALAGLLDPLTESGEIGALAREALRLGGLSSDDGAKCEELVAWASGDLPRTVEVARRAHAARPHLQSGLLLAGFLMVANQPAEALAVLEGLRRLPRPAGTDPRIDLSEASLADQSRDLERALGAVRRARAEAERRGARSLAAAAATTEAWTLLQEGEPRRALALAEGAQLVQAALGAQADLALTENLLGTVATYLGKPRDAIAHLDQAAALAAGTSLDPALNAVYAAIAVGDLDDSRRRRARLSETVPPAFAPLIVALVLVDLDARLASRAGDLRGAVAWHGKAESLIGPTTNSHLLAGTYAGWAFDLLMLGELQAARRKLDLARGAPGKMMKMNVDSFDVALLLEEGRVGEADALARSVAELCAGQLPDSEARARTYLARAALARGNLAAARAAADAATALSAQHEVHTVLVEASAWRARVLGASGELAEARAEAARAMQIAGRYPEVKASLLEARLAAAEVGIASGDGKARAAAAAVEKEARAMGHALLAARAARAVAGRPFAATAGLPRPTPK